MSQSPDGGGYNPYGSNPSNPNYPPAPGTAYGGPQPPSGPNPYANTPAGPTPGYNPPSGPGAPTPNSSYGPYGNPYAPPPPPGVTPGQHPYTNPSNPMSPGTGPNSYNPYDPTVISQQSSPAYPIYSPPSGPGSPSTPFATPPQAPQPKQGRSMTMLISIIALLLVVGGSIFGVVAYNNNQATLHANATATAQANLNLQASATAHVAATATAIASTYPFSTNLVLNDPLVDNSKGVDWDNDGKFCFFRGSAYHVFDNQANTYQTCAANKTDYTNFTFQVEMVIKSGGDSAGGGLIFRADNADSKYYRLYIDQQGNYGILVSVDTTGTNGNARRLQTGVASQFTTGLGQTNTIGVAVRGDQISFYVDHQQVTTVTDSTYTHGQIGVTADELSGNTEVIYTNAKLWQL